MSSCVIHICSCPYIQTAHVCPSQMGGNAQTNFCPDLAALVAASPCAVHEGCVCPCLLGRTCPTAATNLKIYNATVKPIGNAASAAGKWVHDSTLGAWDNILAWLSKALPSLSKDVLVIFAVLFVMFLATVFVYAFAKSR